MGKVLIFKLNPLDSLRFSFTLDIYRYLPCASISVTELDLIMAEIVRPDCFNPRHPSKNEMARQLLEESIRIIEYHLENARADKDQNTIEIIFDMLTKSRRLLRKVQSDPVTP